MRIVREIDRPTWLCLAVALILLCPVLPARADVMTTGQVTLVTPPPTTRLGQLQSDATMYLFPEKRAYVLPASVNVDITAPGNYTAANATPYTPGVIAAGTQVNSWMVHFNPPDGPIYGSGSLTFSGEKVLGVIASDANLDATDGLLGAPGTLYSTGVTSRGLEINDMAPGSNFDNVILSSDFLTLALLWRAGVSEDEIRILTESVPLASPPVGPPAPGQGPAPPPPPTDPAVPEPTAIAAWALAIGIALAWRYRRRNEVARNRPAGDSGCPV